MADTELPLATRVTWAVQADSVLVIDQARHTCLAIPYPAAAVWDLVTRGYDSEKIVAMVAAIAGLATGDARRLVRRCREDWELAGLLSREGGIG